MQTSPKAPVGIDQLARTVIGTTLGLKRGETVLIEAWSNSLPYAEAFQREARRVGAKPIVIFESEPVYWETVDAGKTKELGVPPKAEWAALAAADAYVYFWGPSDRTRVRALPAKKQQELTAYNGRWYDVAAKNGIRGARIELALAEAGNAESYGVDLDAWRAELLAASAADPKQMQKAGTRLQPSLERGSRIRITHPNGTDLTLGLKKGRKLIVDDGRVDAADVRAKRNIANVPGGSAVIAVDESVADGVIVGNQPSRYDQMRKRMLEPRWEFRGGKLVSMSAAAGGEEFEAEYRKAPKGKERPGLFEIGLNPEMRMAPTFEDQEAGAVTLYIGGNQGYGGASKVPFNVYLIVRGATVEVDGKTLVRDGKLL